MKKLERHMKKSELSWLNGCVKTVQAGKRSNAKDKSLGHRTSDRAKVV